MTLENIVGGLKLAMVLASVFKNPEEAILKAIEDFRNTDNSEMTKIKESLCKKLECDDINIKPGETSIFIEFQGIEKPLDVFAINLVGFAYKLIKKMNMFITPFLPSGIDINNILKQLSVTNNETTNIVTIEFPGRTGMITLEMYYVSEREIASIEIPFKSERVLNKLKEMQEL